jgi:RNA polymerase sigma-70 factor (ECF subfamily)
MRNDPLRDLKPLIDRVYAYVAYRVGSRADSEDVTSEVFERALRYRNSYDPGRGEPIQWLIGIAQRCIDDWRRGQYQAAGSETEGWTEDATDQSIDRLAIVDAIARLEGRDRELIALRYGADLSTRQIAKLLELEPNAVDVAVHRARGRLKVLLAAEDPQARRSASG